MFPLEPSVIKTLTVLGIFVSVTAYLLIALRHTGKAGTGLRADKYLRFREDGANGASGISGDVLNMTFMASAFSLASAIYVYWEWAAYDGLLALWSPITWGAGVYVLYRCSKAIFAAGRETWTIHSYLGSKFSRPSLTKVSSLVTSLVFLLQIAAEVVVGLAVLKSVVGSNVPLSALSIVVGAIFIGYSIVGGLPSVLVTDKLQYRLIAFAILGVVLVGLNDGGATAISAIRSSAKTFIPSGGNIIMVLGLLALNLPLLITDMSVWQRIAASSSAGEAERGSRKFVWSLVSWMTLLVVFGVGFGSIAMDVGPEVSRPAVRLLTFFSGSIVYPLIIAGLLSALLSTADTFLMSSVQTLVVDWRYKRVLEDAQYDASSLSEDVHARMIRDSRIGVLLFGVVSVVLGLLVYRHVERLLEFLFITFGLQTALAPCVIASLRGKAREGLGTGAVWSVVVGGLIAVAGLIGAMAGVSMFGVTVSLWTPLFTLGGAYLVFWLIPRAGQTS